VANISFIEWGVWLTCLGVPLAAGSWKHLLLLLIPILLSVLDGFLVGVLM